MSFAGDILRAAVDKQRALHDQHLVEMQTRSEALTDTIKRPWQTRVAAIGEAVKAIRSIVGSPTGEPEKPAEADPSQPIGFHAEASE